MEWMSRADIVLLSVAGYVAVMALVRLMKQRHDVVVADVERQINAHRRAVKRRREKEKDEHRDAA